MCEYISTLAALVGVGFGPANIQICSSHSILSPVHRDVVPLTQVLQCCLASACTSPGLAMGHNHYSAQPGTLACTDCNNVRLSNGQGLLTPIPLTFMQPRPLLETQQKT